MKRKVLTAVSILLLLLSFAISVRSIDIATDSYYLDVPIPIATFYIGKYTNNTYYACNGGNWSEFVTSTNASYVFQEVASRCRAYDKVIVFPSEYIITHTIGFPNLHHFTLEGYAVNFTYTGSGYCLEIEHDGAAHAWGSEREGNVIKGFHLTGTSGSNGIYLNNSDFCHIEDVTTQGFYYGMVIQSDYNHITRSVITNSTNDGVRFESASFGNTLSNSFVRYSGDDGVYNLGENNTVRDSEIYYNDGQGIYFLNVAVGTIEGNDIYENGDNGVHINTATTEFIEVKDNHIKQNGRNTGTWSNINFAASVVSEEWIVIEGNAILGNMSAGATQPDYGVRLDGNTDDIVVRNNRFGGTYTVSSVTDSVLDSIFTGNTGYNQIKNSANWKVTTDGTYYTAQKGDWSAVTTSANASYVIQTALDGLTSGRDWVETVTCEGDIEITHTLILPNFTRFEFEQLKLANNANCTMIQNEDAFTGYSQEIHVIGGELSGNSANQGTGLYHGIHFWGVRRGSIRNVNLWNVVNTSVVINGSSTYWCGVTHIENVRIYNSGFRGFSETYGAETKGELLYVQNSTDRNVWLGGTMGKYDYIHTYNSTGSHGIEISGHDYLLSGLESEQNSDDGVVITGYQNRIVGGVIYNNTDHGVVISGYGNTITASTIEFSGDEGIYCTGENNTITDNMIYYNGEDGIRFYQTEHSGQVIGNTIYHNGQRGIFLESYGYGKYLTIMGNFIYENGRTLSQPNIWIWAGGTIESVLVIGNTILGNLTAGAPQPQYGLATHSQAQNVMVAYNHFGGDYEYSDLGQIGTQNTFVGNTGLSFVAYAPTWILSTDGTTYYAQKDDYTSTVISTNCSYVLETIIAADTSIIFKSGTYAIDYRITITVEGVSFISEVVEGAILDFGASGEFFWNYSTDDREHYYFEGLLFDGTHSNTACLNNTGIGEDYRIGQARFVNCRWTGWTRSNATATNYCIDFRGYDYVTFIQCYWFNSPIQLRASRHESGNSLISDSVLMLSLNITDYHMIYARNDYDSENPSDPENAVDFDTCRTQFLAAQDWHIMAIYLNASNNGTIGWRSNDDRAEACGFMETETNGTQGRVMLVDIYGLSCSIFTNNAIAIYWDAATLRSSIRNSYFTASGNQNQTGIWDIGQGTSGDRNILENNMFNGLGQTNDESIRIDHDRYTIIRNNIGFVTENEGKSTVADNEWIAHGLDDSLLLTKANVSIGIAICDIIYDGNVTACGITTVNATHMQVGLYWTNGTTIDDDVIEVWWSIKYDPDG